jgi:hypothetical protein
MSGIDAYGIKLSQTGVQRLVLKANLNVDQTKFTKFPFLNLAFNVSLQCKEIPRKVLVALEVKLVSVLQQSCFPAAVYRGHRYSPDTVTSNHELYSQQTVWVMVIQFQV